MLQIQRSRNSGRRERLLFYLKTLKDEKKIEKMERRMERRVMRLRFC